MENLSKEIKQQTFNHRFKCVCVCAVADKANAEKYTLAQVINMPDCTIMMTEHC